MVAYMVGPNKSGNAKMTIAEFRAASGNENNGLHSSYEKFSSTASELIYQVSI